MLTAKVAKTYKASDSNTTEWRGSIEFSDEFGTPLFNVEAQLNTSTRGDGHYIAWPSRRMPDGKWHKTFWAYDDLQAIALRAVEDHLALTGR